MARDPVFDWPWLRFFTDGTSYVREPSDAKDCIVESFPDGAAYGAKMRASGGFFPETPEEDTPDPKDEDNGDVRAND